MEHRNFCRFFIRVYVAQFGLETKVKTSFWKSSCVESQADYNMFF